MMVSVDFDGVLTDLSALSRASVDTAVLLWPAVSVQYAARRAGARELVGLLRCFSEISILTARPESHLSEIRRWLSHNLPELSEARIISATGHQKNEVLRGYGIVLHIDDDSLLERDPRIIVWRRDRLPDFLRRVCTALMLLPSLKLARLDSPVTSLKVLPVTSVTPVVKVTTPVGAYKIRLFADQASHARVEQFYALVEQSAAGALLPERFDSAPVTMTTSFIEGVMLSVLDSSAVWEAIPSLASFLAALHEISAKEVEGSLLSCAVDRFNVCIGVAGKPFIVDVGDCTIGDPVMDIVWAEQLLCMSMEQRRKLVELYLKKRRVVLTVMQIEEALRAYYSHLHWVLIQSKMNVHQDSRTWRALQSIVERRRIPPSESALVDWAKS